MPLHTACELNDMNMIEILLKGGANVNAKYFPNSVYASSPGDIPPLFKIFENKNCGSDDSNIVEMVLLLLKYGADVNAEDESGRTVLDITGQDGNARGMLIDAGAKNGSQNARGEYLKRRNERRNERRNNNSLVFGNVFGGF